MFDDLLEDVGDFMPRKIAPEYLDDMKALKDEILGPLSGHKAVVGLRVYPTNTSRGMAYWAHPVITIPVFAIHKAKINPGYTHWYMAHELAHKFAYYECEYKDHGAKFMYWLKLLCPAKYQHYELGYKPRLAAAAGISSKESEDALRNF